MPWVSIFMWVVSFLLAGGTKSGRAGKAALIATGVAAATWFAADPANPDAAWDIFKTDASTTTSPATTVTTPSVKVGAGGVADTAIKSTADVLKSWGPLGTAGVITGTAAATGSGIFTGTPKWVPWALGGLLIYGIVRK